MNYIDKTLLPDEKVVYRSRPHWVIFFKPLVILFAAIFAFNEGGLNSLAAFLGLVTILGYMSMLIFYFTSEFGITNQRVIIKLGFIQRYSFENALDRIESVSVEQSILGRFLDYGSIRICGVGGSSELFSTVPNPLLLRYKVQEQIDRQRLAKKSI